MMKYTIRRNAIVTLFLLACLEAASAASPKMPTILARRDYNGLNSNCVQMADTNGDGIVFRMVPPGAPGAWTENIYAFDTSLGAPYEPGGILIQAGAIYGTASAGGDGCSQPSSCGAAFKLTPPATSANPWTEEMLYSG
jgi:hypothetical protein